MNKVTFQLVLQLTALTCSMKQKAGDKHKNKNILNKHKHPHGEYFKLHFFDEHYMLSKMMYDYIKTESLKSEKAKGSHLFAARVV